MAVWVVLVILAAGVAGYGILGGWGAIPTPPFVAESPDPVAFLLHMMGGGAALLLGPWQFRPGWSGTDSAAHRWIGRGYLVAVLISGMAGLWLARVAQTGLVAALGFGGLGVAWLVTGALAYRRVREHRYQVHRHWMVRNFALTLAAVTLRIQLPLSLGIGIPFDAAYPVIAWACWLPNLAIAEWWIRKHPRRPLALER